MQYQSRLSLFSLVVLLGLVAGFAAGSAVSAKEYSIDAVELKVELQPDGSALVEERRTMSYQGSFSYNFQVFRKSGLDGFIFLSLSDGETVYVRRRSKEPGSYRVRERRKQVEVRWYHDTRDQSRTFVLRYKLLGVVTAYADVAQFYYNLIGSGWKKSTGSVRAVIIPPGERGLPVEKVRAWLHNVRSGDVHVTDDGRVELSVTSLPAKTALPVRVLIPADMFPQAEKRVQEPAASRLISEAEQQVRDDIAAAEKLAERERMRARLRPRFLPLLSAAVALYGLLLFVNLFRHRTRVDSPYYNESYPRLPAEGVSAAVANFVYFRGNVTSYALSAALIELAAQGFLVIEVDDDISSGKKSISKKHIFFVLTEKAQRERPEHLSSAQLLAFLQEISTEGRLSLVQLKKKKKELLEFMEDWRKTISAELVVPFYEPASKKRMKTFLFSGILLSVVCFIAIFFIGPEAAVLAVVSVALSVVSIGLLRQTEAVKRLREHLKRIRRFVRSAKQRTFVPVDTAEIDRYLAFAVALASGRERIRAFLEHSMGATQGEKAFQWFVTSASMDIAALAETTALMVYVTAASFGSTAAVSAGAGGAAGGGGGGAG